MTIINKTKIEWCDSTWNPVTGCYHNCEYCYARKIVRRFGLEDYKEKEELLEPVYDGNDKRIAFPTGFTPTFHKYRLEDCKKKKGQTVFVCSMADLFGKWVPDSWIHAVFDACEKAQQHKYLFLTKNPARYLELGEAGRLPARKNMWYGTTVTNPLEPFFYSDQHNTFLSVEPIMHDFRGIHTAKRIELTDWIIVGAETGNRKEKVVPEKRWIEAITDVSDELRIPVFMKDSLIPIVGEENMRREFPWEVD